MKSCSAVLLSLVLLAGTLTACGQNAKVDEGSGAGGFDLSIAVSHSADIPAPDNPLEQAMESYTGTRLRIHWIPYSAYEEQSNIMIASGELPQLIELTYTPAIAATLKSGNFWDISPYLAEFKNLSAVKRAYYDNISVGGRIYGVPLFRDMGRAIVLYRKDWLERLGLQPPVSLDDWYEVIRAMAQDDPDGNGRDDTYGMVLEKRYNLEASSVLTRISVSQGGPNKWQEKDGRFTPEFMTEPYYQTMLLFRKLYAQQLINPDFAVVDYTEVTERYDSGRAGIQIAGGNGQTWQDKLRERMPDALVDVSPLSGPGGIRVPGEPGNAGFLAIPTQSVRTEAEVRQILGFLDKLLEVPMQTLLAYGIEGRHWREQDGQVMITDRLLDRQEVKPYRDSLPFLGALNPALKPVSQPALYRENQRIVQGNEQYIVPNPALTLESDTFIRKGKELEQLIADAQTSFILGKLDEAGWKAKVEQWKQQGGSQMILEYEEALRKQKE